ncbi:MAG: hypothetical protein WA888_19710 [Burkholderiaceae bacterium]
MSAFLIVRASVPESDREAFETWYQKEHLPEAKAAFKAISARRGWGDVEPGVHWAMYEFSDLNAARAITESDILKGLIAEFDRVWEGRVTRSREVVGVNQLI